MTISVSVRHVDKDSEAFDSYPQPLVADTYCTKVHLLVLCVKKVEAGF